MKQIMLWVGPLLAVVVGLLLAWNGHAEAVAWTAAITTLTAIWWIFEPVPIPVTSLIPLALLPTVGVLDYSQIGAAYGDKLILLMLGGFMLSTAMERSGAHRRIALAMVRRLGGGSPRRLVLGFMLASAGLSMWISNSATALMLLPIALAVVKTIESDRLKTALLLGVAYAASIGGIGTPIGTPPNLVFMDQYSAIDGSEPPTFLEWMSWAAPILLVMLPIAWWWLTRGMRSDVTVVLPDLGGWRTEEIRTLAVFAVTALLWISRKEPFGGWSEWTGLTGVHDSSVALFAVIAMFLIPNGKGERLLDWESASKIPWGILLLYAAGISIARAFTSSGLSQTLGEALQGFTVIHIVLMMALLCTAVTFLTEITSNTATATVLMPVLVAMALAGAIEPRLLMIPATISCSFAFMLPVATPPNAVVFSSGHLTIAKMAREGLALNLIGVVVVTTICYVMFG
ncbi:SLC13 family permease [Mucisphaera sp.]|uniref:SLC13 family permease n=1 Tax=Mucisphaera sp. TaxID=2913024 RepID=UPI003D131FB3